MTYEDKASYDSTPLCLHLELFEEFISFQEVPFEELDI